MVPSSHAAMHKRLLFHQIYILTCIFWKIDIHWAQCYWNTFHPCIAHRSSPTERTNLHHSVSHFIIDEMTAIVWCRRLSPVPHWIVRTGRFHIQTAQVRNRRRASISQIFLYIVALMIPEQFFVTLGLNLFIVSCARMSPPRYKLFTQT